MKHLHLRLFGHFAVTLDETVITEFEALSARALLAYLAVEREQRHTRATLASLLWGLDAGANGLTNLRSCLRRVRNALGEGSDGAFFVATQDELQLAPQAELWVDLHRFEELLAAVTAHPHRRVYHCPRCIAHLTEAVGLYHGPFLDNLTIDSVLFEEWRQVNQERYQRLAMQALAILTDYHYRRGAFPQAEQYARRQLALEVWNEEAHQQLMQILAASGQRSAALAQYNRCRAILAAEFDVAPMPATVSLYEEIRRGGGNAHATLGAINQHPRPKLTNLLPPAAELIDRVAELNWLQDRLVNPAVRLTSIVGEGGVGKTRLAFAAGWALSSCFTDGVWFVALADIASSDDLLHTQREITAAVVTAVGLTLNKHQAAQAQLFDFLATKELLLVLDNFEHLLASTGWLHDLMRAAPNVSILVTSRQPLNFRAEHLLRLTGLAVPTGPDDPAAATYDAVVLFAARASQGYPQFRLTPASLPAVVRICQVVHGLPLGIELAAALVRQLNPVEIAAGLAQHVELLCSNQADLPLRHRSMQAVFEQSWSLLTPAEQQTLICVAIFHNGFDRTAAKAVLQAKVEQLAQLVDKSLLQQDSTGRYEIHDLLRRFVMTRAQGHDLSEPTANHSIYYLDFLCRHERALRGDAGEGALAVVCAELDNIRGAWAWASAQGRFDLLTASAGALCLVCTMLGLWQEGTQLLEETAAALDRQLSVAQSGHLAPMHMTVLAELAKIYAIGGDAGRLLQVARRLVKLGRDRGLNQARVTGHLAWGQSNMIQAHLKRGQRHLELALALTQPDTVMSLRADVLFTLGKVVSYQAENSRAQFWVEQALACYRQLDQRQEEADALTILSHIHQDDPAKVYQVTLQRLRLAQRTGNVRDELHALHRLTILWLNVGNYVQTRECCLQALQLVERMNSAHHAQLFLDFLGLAYHYLGDDITALRYLTELVRLCKQTGDQRCLAYALHWHGQVCLARGEFVNAADCYTQAAEIRVCHHQPYLVLLSQAGLARVRLAQGDRAAAWQLVDPIVAQLDELRHQKMEDAALLWGNCYWVLAANQDARTGAVLNQAYELIQERAGRISDPAMRQTFLENIPMHYQIVDAWQRDCPNQSYTLGQIVSVS